MSQLKKVTSYTYGCKQSLLMESNAKSKRSRTARATAKSPVSTGTKKKSPLSSPTRQKSPQPTQTGSTGTSGKSPQRKPDNGKKPAQQQTPSETHSTDAAPATPQRPQETSPIEEIPCSSADLKNLDRLGLMRVTLQVQCIIAESLRSISQSLRFQSFNIYNCDSQRTYPASTYQC